jgi:serine/threonine protein kinase/class 3 adenylate cyclase
MPAITPSQIRVALITDLVDSTRMVAAVGDATAHAFFARHDRLARDLLARFGGLEIDKSDGFLLLFPHPAPAVEFALAYHQALRELSKDTGQQWRARVGIQLGELFLRENSSDDIAHGAKPLEVEGLAKLVAARLMALAQGGQTLLGHAAFDLAQSAGVTLPGHTLGWLAHGRYRIKGLDQPLAVFEVGALGQAPLAPPPDSEKAHRDITEDERETLGWRPGPDLDIPGRPHWRLRRKLGAGGFGEVWLAEHEDSPAQRVFKFCHDPDRLRSLKREVTVFRLLREALGDRHDIARIIDWQFDRAPFFIESEYIAGGDLLAWAAAQGGLANAPIEQRLAIATQLADALGAAHSVGVLHKDIKPGNVLIRADSGGSPRAVLTDFGIGLVTDKGQLLAHGITIAGLTEMLDAAPTAGSQLYMAPELLEGKAATIQADLYALGVMLYELAAGEFKPLAPGWQRDIDCELLAADIADLVDGDPSRRPASAARVARELRALPERRAQLAAERQAAADAAATRLALAKSQRRRRWSLGIGAVLTLLLMVVSYGTWQTALARDEANLRRDRAERLIGFMLDDLRERLTKVGRLDVMDSVTDAAMDYFKGIPTAQLNDTDLAGRSKVLYQIGDTRLSRGDFEGARQAMAESLELAQALADRAPEEPQRQFDLAQSEYWVGFVELRSARPDAALKHFQRYLDIAQWLVSEDPSRREWQAELGYAYNGLGAVLEAKGDYLAAIRNYRAQLDRLTNAGAGDVKSRDVQMDIANSNNKLGLALETIEQLAQALEHYQREQHILQELVQTTPEDATLARLLATSRYFSARLLLQVGMLDASSSSVRQAIDATEALLARDADNTRWRRDLVVMLQLAAQIDLQRGQIEEAAASLEHAWGVAAPIATTAADLPPTLDLLTAQIAFARNDRAGTASAAAKAAESFAGDLPGLNQAIRDELRAEALLWLAKAEGSQYHGDTLRLALNGLQTRPLPSLRNRATQVRLLLALDDLAGASPLAEQLFAASYRHPQFVAECAAAGVAVPRSNDPAIPQP